MPFLSAVAHKHHLRTIIVPSSPFSDFQSQILAKCSSLVAGGSSRATENEINVVLLPISSSPSTATKATPGSRPRPWPGLRPNRRTRLGRTTATTKTTRSQANNKNDGVDSSKSNVVGLLPSPSPSATTKTGPGVRPRRRIRLGTTRTMMTRNQTNDKYIVSNQNNVGKDKCRVHSLLVGDREDESIENFGEICEIKEEEGKQEQEDTMKAKATEEEQKDQIVVHDKVTCDYCLACPIVGKRYHSTNIFNVDICEKCFSEYNGDRIQFEIIAHSTPAPETQQEGQQNGENHSSGVANKSDSNEPQRKVHWEKPQFRKKGYTRCEYCLFSPIIGKRYRAKNLPDCELCQECFQKYDGNLVRFEMIEPDSEPRKFFFALDLLEMKYFDEEIKRIGSQMNLDVQSKEYVDTFHKVKLDGLALEKQPNDMRANRDIVLVACHQNGMALKYASNNLQNDATIVRVACLKNPLSLNYTSSELRSNLLFLEQVGVPIRYHDEAVKYIGAKTNLDIQSKEYQDAFRQVSTNGLMLGKLSEEMQANKDIVLVACCQNAEALQYASKNLQNDILIVIGAARKNPLTLKHASLELRSEPLLVLRACKQEGNVFRYLPKSLLDDKLVIMNACRQCRKATPFFWASKRVKADRMTAAVAAYYDMRTAFRCMSKDLKSDRDLFSMIFWKCPQCFHFASENLKDDPELVYYICKKDGYVLCSASKSLRADKLIVLGACRQNGVAFQFASENLRSDRSFLLLACQQHNGFSPLRCASPSLKADRDVVITACTRQGLALEGASEELKNDKEIVLLACGKNGNALQFVPDSVKSDKEVVLVACRQNGGALRLAPKELREDKDIVLAAVRSAPDSLKFALNGLCQDPECLVAAGIWDKNYNLRQLTMKHPAGDGGVKNIVLSTRFSLAENSYSFVNQFTILLKQHQYIRDGNFSVYFPNAFNKATCDPEWTNSDWPCRGTFETCEKEDASLKTGIPQLGSCWRYSFRYQLEQAKRNNGFMIQVVDYYRDQRGEEKHILGNGQQIETEMAADVGTKVFRVFVPNKSEKLMTEFRSGDINFIAMFIKHWYDNGCVDKEVAEIKTQRPIQPGGKRLTMFVAPASNRGHQPAS